MKHIPQLDGVRAAAVLFVVVGHTGFGKLVPGGFGVTIFFFLSGYLITSLMRAEMADTGSLDFRGFYLRRTLRILPPLYITMAFSYLAIRLIAPAHPMPALGLATQALFLSNYNPELGTSDALPIPLWSLAVEEHFYLVAPVAFSVMLARWSPRRVAAICAGLCVAILAIRIASIAAGVDPDRIYYWSHTRIDSIVFGCCLALWNNPVIDKAAWRPKIWHVAAALLVLALCLVVRDEAFRQTLRYTLQGLALFVIFSWIIGSNGIVRSALSSYPMRIVGLYSYTIYLCHVTFVFVLEIWFPTISRFLLFPIVLALSLAYGAAMWRFVEAPAARLRKRLHTGSKRTGEQPVSGHAA